MHYQKHLSKVQSHSYTYPIIKFVKNELDKYSTVLYSRIYSYVLMMINY